MKPQLKDTLKHTIRTLETVIPILLTYLLFLASVGRVGELTESLK